MPKKTLAAALLRGVLSGVVLAWMNVSFAAAGIVFYLAHGDYYLSFFYPYNPLLNKSDLLYLDQPMFGDRGIFPLAVIVVATFLSVAGWALILGPLTSHRPGCWKLCSHCSLAVLAVWAIPFLFRAQPDLLVAPMTESVVALFWAILPFSALAITLGYSIDGRRGALWMGGIGVFAIVLMALWPIPEATLVRAFGDSDVARLVMRYADSNEPILQTLTNHYWRSVNWLLILVAWSTALAALGHTLLWLRGDLVLSKAEDSRLSRLTGCIWPTLSDRIVDWTVVSLISCALYWLYIYRYDIASSKQGSFPWVLSCFAFASLGIRSWRGSTIESHLPKNRKFLTTARLAIGGFFACYALAWPGLLHFSGQSLLSILALTAFFAFTSIVLIWGIAKLLWSLWSKRTQKSTQYNSQ